MNASVRCGLTASALAGAALLGSATAAAAGPQPADTRTAEQNGVVVVDEPDTGDLHNKWTFAPLGVPVFGLVDSVLAAPGKLLPLP